MSATQIIVCVPARNEAEHLPSLLKALANQSMQGTLVLLSLNNTTDRSRRVISECCDLFPSLNIVVDEITFPERDAHAGSARRRAMDCAADLGGIDSCLLTTDADARPPPDWIANNLMAIQSGVEVVGGKIVIDEAEPLSDRLAAHSRLADRYWTRVRQIEDAIDPVAWDPPPRHGDHTGASLCVAASVYQHCGGVPLVRSGEDTALVKTIIKQGGRLSHPCSVWTRVSPRAKGRADGGMAEHIMRLNELWASDKSVMVPSFAQWRERALWRRGVRDRGGARLVVELEDDMPNLTNDVVLNCALLSSSR